MAINVGGFSEDHSDGVSFKNDVSTVKLSICIATYSRARFIGQTLDSILAQLEPGIELIVVDGASPDETTEVMSRYIVQNSNLHYYKENINSGVDADYDKAVSYAHGDYCWLMTDDDLLKHGAIKRVIKALDSGQDLIVLNADVLNADYSAILSERIINLPRNKEYQAGDGDTFFADLANALSFIGCVVIKRAAWMSRLRSPYLGSLFVHVGVIFQEPMLNGVLVIADPLISIRYGNAMWTPRGFEIWMFKWPELVWSFTHIAEQSRLKVSMRQPWRRLRKLLFYRAIGGYGLREYKLYIDDKAKGVSSFASMLIALMPARLANALASLYCMIFARDARPNLYDLARSANATWIARAAARSVGISCR